VRLSIIIKALNEETRIAAAIESSLAAATRYGGEVIVADSGSSDGTIAIAGRYPVTVVQLVDFREARCGAGSQLGYQFARGKYLCLLDADMTVELAFIERAMAILEADPCVAGVGGHIEEVIVANHEFRNRAGILARAKFGVVDRLNGGGLYRRTAILDAGYLTDVNLHSYEEYDLGARLRERGWLLIRIDCRAARHHAHRLGSYRLLAWRISSGYIFGIGEVVRAAIADGRSLRALRELRELRLWIALWLYWAGAVTIAWATSEVVPVWVWLGAALLAIVVIALIIKKSVALGFYSALAWHAFAVSLAVGLLRPRKPPREHLAARILIKRED
jgi:glycosyltransferase involved in cell wall biosynthesis